MGRKIYLASSWRNPHQPAVLAALREAGHEVYDFRNPEPGNDGFRWSQIGPDSLRTDPDIFVHHVTTHPTAASGFKLDKDALDWADTCVLALPCGRSAHLELGYAVGQGKETFVLLAREQFEPELMYLLCTGMVTCVVDLIDRLAIR